MQLGCAETFLGSGSELCITKGWKQGPPLVMRSFICTKGSATDSADEMLGAHL